MKKFKICFPVYLIFLSLLFAGNCRQQKPGSGELYRENLSVPEFDKIARTLFKDIYFYLARQIKEDYNITRGVGVDAGSGPGYLAIELAKITELEIIALDIDPEAVKIARRNVKKAKLEGRVKPVLGDVEKMPFPENFADLVISRGSYLFWKDKVKAFREIWRILKPGGVALIGGGMGDLLPQELREKIRKEMEEKGIGPPQSLALSIPEMAEILRKAAINCFEISTDEGCACGLWIEFKKVLPEQAD